MPSSDRSSRPISTTKVSPMVVRPSTLTCSRMLIRLMPVAKFGANRLKKASIRISTTKATTFCSAAVVKKPDPAAGAF